LSTFPVEAVSFNGRDAEAPDVVRIIEETRRRSRCKWKDFAVLYRSHVNRDDVVQHLAEHEIPFTIENMDVSDTPEVRDLFACVATVVDLGSDASLFRVAALRNSKWIRNSFAMRCVRSQRSRKRERSFHWLQFWTASPVVRQCWTACAVARNEVDRKQAKTRAAMQLIGEQFGLNLDSAVLQAALKFAADWEQKATTETKELGEWIEYLGYFREACGTIPLASKENEDAVRLMTAHGAKGTRVFARFHPACYQPFFSRQLSGEPGGVSSRVA